MSYQADLYIVLPCIQKEVVTIENPVNTNAELFIDELSNVAKYEFNNAMSDRIERTFLKEIILNCKTDDRDNPTSLGLQDAFIIQSQFRGTNYCLLTIVVVNTSVSLTHLLDQVSRREMVIIDEGKEVYLTDWVKDYGLESTGKAFYASCISDLPDKEAPYIMAGEAYNADADFRIMSNTIGDSLAQNQAQYTHYEAYMSECGIIYVVKDFDSEYSGRLNTECIMIFILELVILKITAINAANNEIVSAFADNYVSINEIHNIMEQFALSLPLWDIRHFRYFLAQDFANKIEKAFNVPRFIAEYEKNRVFLEQLINVRKLITSEKESRMIELFATVLAMLQVVPHLFNMVLYIMRGSVISLTQIMSLTISSAVAFLIMWLLFGRKKNGNK